MSLAAEVRKFLHSYTRKSPIVCIFSEIRTISGGIIVMSLAAKVRNSSIITLANRRSSAFFPEIRTIFGGSIAMSLAAAVRKFVHSYTRKSPIVCNFRRFGRFLRESE